MTHMLDLTPEHRLLEAVIFASGEPVTVAMLIQQLGDGVNVLELLYDLKRSYEQRGVNLVETDGGSEVCSQSVGRK